MPLSYSDIAIRQFDHALNLYLSNGDLVCALTLAGAAEEILGRLAMLKGHEPALKRSALRKAAMFRALFPKNSDPGVKAFITLSNKPRNMMKHLLDDPIGNLDLEGETGRLLKRAVENYTLVFGMKNAKMRRFETVRIRRARTAQDN